MRSLFKIGADLEALEQLLTDIDGEILEGEIGRRLEAYMADLHEERDEKVRRICCLIEMMLFAVEACKEESRRISKLGRANENGAERIKEWLKGFFEQHNIQKLDLRTFRPRIQARGGQRALLFPEQWQQEPASAPERYHRPVIHLNTELMREDAEAFEAKFARFQKALADGQLSIEEYEAAVSEAQSANPVRLAPRGNHLRLR